ncbi:MAG: hypothetical protein U0640_00860 [Phycisphaerales bacterium]
MKVCKIMLVAGLSCGMFVAGCDQAKNSAEKATSAAGDAAKKAGEVAKDAGKAAGDAAAKGVDAAKDAGKAVADTAGKAVDATKDAAHSAADKAKEVGDAAGKALEAAKAESTKWLNDTVTKQWPGIKTEVEGLGKSIEGIKDTNIKAKAQTAWTDLKAQIPAVEKAVDGLKNFKDGDFTKMFGEVKTMWDNFGKKLGDLKGMLPK